MALRIIVPFKLQGAKSRLSPVLSQEEREKLALAMLCDVLDAVSWAGDVTVLTRPGFAQAGLSGSFAVLESSLGLNDAINSIVDDSDRHGWTCDILIVMADLALLTRKDVEGVLQTNGDVVLSPGRGGGTNMILVRNGMFRTRYWGLSFPKHICQVEDLGLDLGVYASYRSGCDIDEPEDLAEIMIHSAGRARSLLAEIGFSLSEDGRAGCVRQSSSNQIF